MAETSTVNILSHFQISPPPGSVSSSSLPLSFLDIPWLPCIPMERLFFFEHPHPTHYFLQTVLPTLSHSLSLTLQHFFPFASNLICPPPPRKPHILYIDGGSSIALTVADSTADFNHLIADHPRDVTDFHPLTPKLPSARVMDDGSRVHPLMAIQVTIFSSAGFSIGVTFHHVAADGRSFHHFMKSWASICRNRGMDEEREVEEPCHGRGEIKDPNELELCFLNSWWDYYRAPESSYFFSFTDKVRSTIVLRRAQIQKLKQWVSDSERATAMYVSTFVVASSLIWVCMLRSEQIEDEDNMCNLVFLADCRNRYELSIPSAYFGNCIAFCYVQLKRKEVVGELGFVKAAKAIGDKVKELEGGALKGAETWMEKHKEMIEQGQNLVTVAASPKFKVYQTDFGWGKLKKSEVVHNDKSAVLSLAEGRDDEGDIEVGLSLPEAQMNRFNVILKTFLQIA